MQRRKKGLYFYCDENFQPGHKCKPAQLLLITTEEDEEPPSEAEVPGISFHALFG